MKTDRNRVKRTGRINETLLEMIIGILVFALVCQVSVVWLVTDKSGYSIGLWLGTLMAVAAAYHMWYMLDKALDHEAGAMRTIQKGSIVRYAVIVIILGIVMATKLCNPLAVFLGIMGLKISAYLQPFIHRLKSNRNKQ